MKTQVTKQHTNVVAVQPLTSLHKEDRMKNAHLALFARQGTTRHFVASRGVSMRHFNAMLVIALFALLFVNLHSATNLNYGCS